MATRQADVELPIPPNEDERLEELHSLRLLDTAAEERFDRYTRLIADLFDFPVVLVTLVDKDRQWFKSNCGLDFNETEREVSFCAHAITEAGVFIVADARKDPRFNDNRLVTGPPHIRFYAGCTVHGPSGLPLGTLCVVDCKPREFDQRKCEQLKQFATMVEREIAYDQELDNLRASIEYKAYYDPLTGLANKRLFRHRLQSLLGMRQHEGGHLAVALFNVGGLRYVNQAFGISTGNELLREVAERLERAAPAEMEPAHLGGGRFALVLPVGCDDVEAIDDLLAPIRESLDRPHYAGEREHFIKFRIGVSVYPEHAHSADELVERAETAAHEREARTASDTQHYDPTHTLRVSERLHVETRLKRGLEEGNFRFEYQPIVSLTEGCMCAAEALIRWDDEDVEDTSPSLFIPIAEQAGLILPMGEWIVEAIASQIRHWSDANDGWEVPVTMNISPPQLQQHDFARKLLDEIERFNVESELVRLEVTEHSLVLDTQRVRDNLETLAEAGIRCLIDDFGTGYCSVAYLGRIPVSGFKIDRAFLRGVPSDSHDVAITRTLLAMARSLEFDVVAEGVERGEQLEFLLQEGCPNAQGFLLARPMTPDDIPGQVGRKLA